MNVAAQLSDRDSLLTWMQRLINVRRECPECGDGALSLIDGEGIPPQVLAHRIDGTDGSASTVLFLHNLSDTRQVVDLSKSSGSDATGAPPGTVRGRPRQGPHRSARQDRPAALWLPVDPPAAVISGVISG